MEAKTIAITTQKQMKKEISIFRTSATKQSDIIFLSSILNTLVGARNWNFDLEDKDNILRVNYYPIMNNFLAREIQKAGFECSELF